jgi:hypothetical protein
MTIIHNRLMTLIVRLVVLASIRGGMGWRDEITMEWRGLRHELVADRRLDFLHLSRKASARWVDLLLTLSANH